VKSHIRYGAKALIIEGGRILCLRKRGDIGDFIVLPGGGQLPGELLTQALERECREELGARVEVGRLRYLQEYVGDNHLFRQAHGGLHFVNAYFECRLLDPPGSLPLEPDVGQVGWEWIAVEALGGLPFYPRVLAARLAADGADGQGDGPAYLGDSV
jgi:8-oxo-dGTP pyrophosphatase MutT (NUDIX family)